PCPIPVSGTMEAKRSQPETREPSSAGSVAFVVVTPGREYPCRVDTNRGETNMIGMDFNCFVILLVISVVVSWILHFGLNYYVTAGWWSFGSKVVVGWIGAWLGSPVFGHWWPGLQYQDVFFIPAILGALAMLLVAVDLAKMSKNTRK